MKRLASLALLAACGAPPAPNAPSASDAVIVVRSNIPDAQVVVDGRVVGPVAALRRGIAVDPGRHRVELRRDDYFSRYVELDVARGQREKLSLDLAPVLP